MNTIMNRPSACIFGINEMGNKEFTWSGLNYYNLDGDSEVSQPADAPRKGEITYSFICEWPFSKKQGE